MRLTLILIASLFGSTTIAAQLPPVPPVQNASSSAQPIMLLTRMNAGHGIGAPFSQRVGDTAIGLTFFAHELGLKPGP